MPREARSVREACEAHAPPAAAQINSAATRAAEIAAVLNARVLLAFMVSDLDDGYRYAE
jgi:hypothetical protein